MSKEIKVNQASMTAEIDLTKNMLYVIKDGTVTIVDPPSDGFGDQTIQWQHGKVSLIKTTTVKKI